MSGRLFNCKRTVLDGMQLLVSSRWVKRNLGDKCPVTIFMRILTFFFPFKSPSHTLKIIFTLLFVRVEFYKIVKKIETGYTNITEDNELKFCEMNLRYTDWIADSGSIFYAEFNGSFHSFGTFAPFIIVLMKTITLDSLL